MRSTSTLCRSGAVADTSAGVRTDTGKAVAADGKPSTSRGGPSVDPQIIEDVASNLEA